MKTSTQIITTLATAAAALALGFADVAVAQPGPGMGAGPAARQAGPGGWRGMRFDQTNTPGWTLMTAEERAANQARMRAVKTYDECKQVQNEQHQVKEARAKEKGVTLAAPRQNSCDVAKARGWLK
jgi:hypothetical protein